MNRTKWGKSLERAGDRQFNWREAPRRDRHKVETRLGGDLFQLIRISFKYSKVVLLWIMHEISAKLLMTKAVHLIRLKHVNDFN